MDPNVVEYLREPENDVIPSRLQHLSSDAADTQGFAVLEFLESGLYLRWCYRGGDAVWVRGRGGYVGGGVCGQGGMVKEMA